VIHLVDLESIRDCLRGGLPAPLATCSPDGTPNISHVSVVQYLDHERVATSRQFFNGKLATLDASPFSQAIVVRPTTAEQFRLDLRYLHTTTEGEEFEAMRANLDAVASQTGMGSVFRLRGLDVHRVLRCSRLHPRALSAATAPAGDSLGALEQFVRRLESSVTYEEATQVALEGLDDLFGFRHSILLALDQPSARLFAVASLGYAKSAVGADVPVGTGLIGTAASRRRIVVQANMTRSRAMAKAVVDGAPEARDVPLPGLAGAQSVAAVPLVVGQDVLGVLYLESQAPSAFGGRTEPLLRIIGGHTAAALAARGAPRRDDPGHPPRPAPAPDGGPPIELVYYQADDTVLCDSAYIVKGAPGRILWSMLKAHAEAGRTQFSNRELRLDESLGLPAGNDNLEARLLVLRRRLADLDCGIALERVGRGRLELTLDRPASLAVVPTNGPMRGAYEPA
jgi:GAF domain